MRNDDDDIIIALGRAIEAKENGPHEINWDQVNCLKAVEEELNNIIDGENIVIKSKIHDPYPSMGAVGVIGTKIMVRDRKTFMKAFEAASIVDICPKTDGTVQMDFTFDGLTKR